MDKIYFICESSSFISNYYHYIVIIVQCMGTEDRVSDPKKIIPSNSVIIPYVTFPGQEIKDLIPSYLLKTLLLPN